MPVTSTSINRPCIVIGAFDRHNFGDLLFAHTAAALLPDRPLIFAGVGARDLRPWGGHSTQALAAVASTYKDDQVDLLHAGGELLSCGAWHAAAMLLPADEATEIIVRLEADDVRRQAYVRETLGMRTQLPYIAGRQLFPRARAIIHNAIGGVGIKRDGALWAEAREKLGDADFIGVREQVTLGLLQQAGLHARLMPDPASLLRELFDPLLAQRGRRGECAAIRAEFPNGYLAFQCSADFGDDATLDLLGAQLEAIAAESGLGVVLFRAGAAPWHDDEQIYRRLQGRLGRCRSHLFGSLDVFNICALIGGSAGYCGSSLHGRIVAMAFGLPRVNLKDTAVVAGKTTAYAACWDDALPGAVAPAALADAMVMAMAMPAHALRSPGRLAALRYHAAFDAIRVLLD